MNQGFELYQNLHAGQMDRMNRLQTALLAKEMDLDPSEYALPFPGNKSEHNVTINNHYPKVEAPPQQMESRVPAVKKGISPLAAIGIGLLSAAVPSAGILWHLLNKAPAVVQQVEKIVDRPVEKVVTIPGRKTGVEVEMEIEPPQENQ